MLAFFEVTAGNVAWTVCFAVLIIAGISLRWLVPLSLWSSAPTEQWEVVFRAKEEDLTIWHILKFTISSLSYFTFSPKKDRILFTENVGSEVVEVICEGYGHDSTSMFGNGKYISLPCTKPQEERSYFPSPFYQVSTSHVQCVDLFSDKSHALKMDSRLKMETLGDIYQLAQRTQMETLRYCTGGGHVFSDMDTRVGIQSTQSVTARLFTRIGMWICAAGDNTIYFYNTVTREMTSRAWEGYKPTAVLVSGEDLYVAASNVIKKLKIPNLWEVSFTDIQQPERKAGGGSFSEVYLGMYKNTEPVARKEYKSEGEASITRELEILSIIGYHRNVIGVLGTTTYNGKKSIILRQGGQSLHRLLGPEPLNKPQVLSIAIGIAQGLHHIHSHNVVHCDLKPANILVDENYIPQLCDFGLARYVEERLTEPFGTEKYMPPGFCLKDAEVDWQKRYPGASIYVDMFSFGTILEEILNFTNMEDPKDFDNFKQISDYCTNSKHGMTAIEVIRLLSSLKDTGR